MKVFYLFSLALMLGCTLSLDRVIHQYQQVLVDFFSSLWPLSMGFFQTVLLWTSLCLLFWSPRLWSCFLLCFILSGFWISLSHEHSKVLCLASPSLLSVGGPVVFLSSLAPQQFVKNSPWEPGLFMPSCAVPPACIRVVIVPQENQQLWLNCFLQLSEEDLFYLIFFVRRSTTGSHNNASHVDLFPNPDSHKHKWLNYKSLFYRFFVCVFWVDKCYKLHWNSSHKYISITSIWISGFAVLLSNYWSWEERRGRCVISTKWRSTASKEMLVNPDICSNINWVVSLLRKFS